MRTCIAMLFVCGLLALSSCADRGARKVTPAEAKNFLILRGYKFDEPSFLKAVNDKDTASVSAFLTAGINPNTSNAESGENALGIAAAQGDLPTVNILLQAGADVNAKDGLNFTPLLRALEHKQDAVGDRLLSLPNIELNAQGPDSVTVLMVCVGREREDVVSNLLLRGANVNLADADGDTALHRAAQTGNLKILQMLLARGAKPNPQNKIGGTPLMWAGVYGHEDIVRELLAHGADPRIKDADGHTAAYWADKNDHLEVAKVLRDAEKGGK